MAVKTSWSSGDVLTAADLTDTFAAKVSSKVLQVVQATYATEVTSTSSTYADSGLSATITPSSTSNKIMAIAFQSFRTFNASGGATGAVRLLRGATAIYTPAQLYAYGSEQTGIRIPVTVAYLDSPSSTSATTYKTQIAANTGSQVWAQPNSLPSVLILMEVAP